jgi:hypothetical protein
MDDSLCRRHRGLSALDDTRARDEDQRIAATYSNVTDFDYQTLAFALDHTSVESSASNLRKNATTIKKMARDGHPCISSLIAVFWHQNNLTMR